MIALAACQQDDPPQPSPNPSSPGPSSGCGPNPLLEGTWKSDSMRSVYIGNNVVQWDTTGPYAPPSDYQMLHFFCMSNQPYLYGMSYTNGQNANGTDTSKYAIQGSDIVMPEYGNQVYCTIDNVSSTHLTVHFTSTGANYSYTNTLYMRKY